MIKENEGIFMEGQNNTTNIQPVTNTPNEPIELKSNEEKIPTAPAEGDAVGNQEVTISAKTTEGSIAPTQASTEAPKEATTENATEQPEEKKEHKEIKTKNPDAFNYQEQVLYTQEEEKESNPVIVAIILAILGLFIVFLPKINERIQGLLHPQVGRITVPPAPTPVQAESEKTNLNGDGYIKVEIDGLEFTNFVKAHNNVDKQLPDDKVEYDLTFTLINTSEDPYLFDKKLYIVFYNENRELMKSLVHSYEPLTGLGTTEMSVKTNKMVYDSADSIKIEYISEQDYPKAKIEKEENDFKILTCHYINDEVIYYFKDDLLNKIDEKYKASKSTTINYEKLKSTKYSEHLNLKSTKGVESTFVETDSDFTIINNITLGDTDYQEFNKLQHYYYFKNNANPDIVAYEVQALGYTCG